MMPAVCDIRYEGTTIILTPLSNVGELDYDRFQRNTESAFAALGQGQMKNVVVNFGKTDFFGSHAVNLLLQFQRGARLAGGKMALCGLSDHAREVLKVMTLETYWEVFDSEEQALAAVRN